MSPRETCQPHIAVGWQVIEKILKTERILKQTDIAQTVLNKILWMVSPNTNKGSFWTLGIWLFSYFVINH